MHSIEQWYTTVTFPEIERHEVTWQPRSPTDHALVKATWVPVVGNTLSVPELVYFPEATVLTGKEQLSFYTLKTSTEVRLIKIHLHWWNCPLSNDVSQNKGKFLSIWNHFPFCVLDTHVHWVSRERKTKVACAKIVPCSTGNHNSLTAKASPAISREALPAQLGAHTGFCGMWDIWALTKMWCTIKG